MGGFLIFVGLVGIVIATISLIRGHLDWARIGSRRVAVGALVGAVVVTGIGGAVSPTPEEATLATGGTAGTAPSALVSPSPEQSPSLMTSPPPAPVESAATTDALISQAAPESVLAVLGALAVKGRAPMTGYDRDQFGQAWADIDRNGCDTRNDILRRDLSSVVIEAGTNGCKVTSGAAAPERYTGGTVQFVYSGGSEIDIDHVVALGNAWQTGAQQWITGKRLALANDPLNLLAVQASANRQKGDGDAATWLPPNKSYRCDYVARQTAVKAKYELWVTVAERDAMARILATCPLVQLPAGDTPTLAPNPPSSTAAVAPAPAPPRKTVPAPASPTEPPSADVYYKNCDAARAAGAAPVRAGDPGYSRKLDRDGDGVGCE